MQGVALIAHFEGDSEDLEHRFQLAAQRYAASADATEPSSAVLLRNKDGIAAVLVWPEGTSLQPFRTFLQNTLGEVGLPHPRVEHLRASAIGWDAITQSS